MCYYWVSFFGMGFLMPVLINHPRALSSACPCTGRPDVLSSGCLFRHYHLLENFLIIFMSSFLPLIGHSVFLKKIYSGNPSLTRCFNNKLPAYLMCLIIIKLFFFSDGGCPVVRQVQRPTLRMLRSIILLTQSMDNVPDNVFLSMRLLYYDQGKLKLSTVLIFPTKDQTLENITIPTSFLNKILVYAILVEST